MLDADIEAWNKVAHDYNKLINKGGFLKVHLLDKVVLELLANIKNKKTLDAGCGQGYLTRIINELGGDVVGVDGSHELIKLAKKINADESVRFMECNLKNSLPFASAEFDIILCNMALMDFDPIDKTIQEFARILKNHGIFILSIIHPLSRGKLKKTFFEKILFKLPHLKISDYKTNKKDLWQIKGLHKPTNVYHRSLEYYIKLLSENHFYVQDLREPVLDKNLVKNKNNFLKLCAEIPPFLVIKAMKLTGMTA